MQMRHASFGAELAQEPELLVQSGPLLRLLQIPSPPLLILQCFAPECRGVLMHSYVHSSDPAADDLAAPDFGSVCKCV